MEFSPGVRRMQALVGQDAPFNHGREQMKLLAGLEVTIKSIERTAEAIGEDIAQREREEIEKAIQLDLPIVGGESIPVLYVEMDGTGVPVVKKETVGRQGKTDGHPAHTREVKLGCVFTQATTDEEGFPIRDPNSTTYTGAIETAEEFGKRIYLEACQRGWSGAAKKVVLGDGAEWIWNLAGLHFPGAIEIVDLYHARQHLWELARKLPPNDAVKQKAWMALTSAVVAAIKVSPLSLASVRATCVLPTPDEPANKRLRGIETPCACHFSASRSNAQTNLSRSRIASSSTSVSQPALRSTLKLCDFLAAPMASRKCACVGSAGIECR